MTGRDRRIPRGTRRTSSSIIQTDAPPVVTASAALRPFSWTEGRSGTWHGGLVEERRSLLHLLLMNPPGASHRTYW